MGFTCYTTGTYAVPRCSAPHPHDSEPDTKRRPALDVFARCFDLPFKERVAEAVSLVGMQEDKVRLRDDEVKEGTACAAARLALAPLT